MKDRYSVAERGGSPALRHGSNLAAGAALGCRYGHRDRLLRAARALRVAPRRCGREAQLLAQLVLDFVANVRVFLQEHARILAALSQALALVGNPRAGFLEQVPGDAEIEQIAFAGNAFAVENVEFRLAERRRHLGLHHFGSRARANHAVAFLDGLNAANVETN